MKLFFLKNDSLYKIFTSIEKVSKHSSIDIFIESENQFFDNPRWAKQIKQLCEEKWLTIRFVTENIRQKNFYEKQWLPFEFRQQHARRKILNLVYRFFFNIKKFHIAVYQAKNYAFFAVFGAEMFLMILICYLLYSLILPQSTITITPAYTIDEVAYNFRYIPEHEIADYPYKDAHIIVPLITWSIKTHVDMTIDGQYIQYISHPAKGEVRIVNKTSDPLNLVKNTQLITDDGIIFTTDNRVNVPATNGTGQAGYGYVTATANINDDAQQLIGARANLPVGTKLTIKKLKQSNYTQQIYAEVSKAFVGWAVNKSGTIVASDIWLLQKKMYDSITSDTISRIKKTISVENTIVLPFPELTSVTGCQYSAIGKNNELKQLTSLSWSLDCMIDYYYITPDGIRAAITQYMTQRPSLIQHVIDINTTSTILYQLMTGSHGEYIIPTKVNIVQWYDFDQDHNGIIAAIKEQIVWLDSERAKEIVLGFPEITNAQIDISPPRYTSISSLKSRIFVKVAEKSE